MKTLVKVLCVAMALLVSFSVNAQKKEKKEKTFAGSIKYAITYDDDADPQLKQMGPSNVVMYVMEGRVRMDQVSPMYTMSIITLDDGSAIMLFDGMGQKYGAKNSKEDVDKAKAEAEANAEETKDPVVNVTDETKTIAGYKCNKVEVTDESGETMEVFVTEEIPMPAVYSEAQQIKGIKGIPMQYSMPAQKMTMTAKEVKKGGVNKSMFMITDDYQNVGTIDDMMKMLGGGM